MTDRMPIAVALLAVTLAVTLIVYARDTRQPQAVNPSETATPAIETRIVYQVITAIPSRTPTPTVWPTRTPMPEFTPTPKSLGRGVWSSAGVEIGEDDGTHDSRQTDD